MFVVGKQGLERIFLGGHVHPFLGRMGMCPWGIHGFGGVQPQTRTPRLSVRCEYPGTGLPPTAVSFRLSPSYGILTLQVSADEDKRSSSERCYLTAMRAGAEQLRAD